MSAEKAQPVRTTPNTSQQYFNDPTLATRRLQNQTQYAGRTTTAAHGAHLHAVADPNGMQTGFMTGFQDTGRVHTGIVVDGTAIANCYRVHLDGGHCPVFAASMSHTSQACLGATEINSYAPGTRVAVMYQAKDNKAVIIGSFADGLDIGKRAFHDYIS
jgi:hypothetical protein